MSTETMLQATVLNSPDRTRGDSLMTPTNTTELIKALERADGRASVKILVKDYADGWYELEVSHRPNVEQLRAALASTGQTFGLRYDPETSLQVEADAPPEPKETNHGDNASDYGFE